MRRARATATPLLLALASSGCARIIGLDEFQEARRGPDEPVFDAYRFSRGAGEFSVSAQAGVLANEPSGSSVVSSGPLSTSRGGRLELSRDGSFVYSPPGAVGVFWGDDELEYTVAQGPVYRSARVRLTVQPSVVDLPRVTESPGAGFGMYSVEGATLGLTPGSMSAGGDVNGDGLEDFMLGLPGEDLGGYGAYVVFGKTDDDTIALYESASRGQGFGIEGAGEHDRLGVFSVASAGDVNGDGLDDMILGAPAFLDLESDDLLPGALPGRAYVVFGKPDSSIVPTNELLAGSSRGFVIEGTDDVLGLGVASAGDFNGDGFDDVIVGAPATSSSGPFAGAAYIVFGKAQPENVRIPAPVPGTEPAITGGIVLLGAAEGDIAGSVVAAGGDINGDGLDDVIVGAPDKRRGPALGVGSAYVVHGKRDTLTVRLAELELPTPAGFQILGVDAFDSAGYPLSGAVDVNGDGLDDVAVGAYRATLGSSPLSEGPDAGALDGGLSEPAVGFGVVYVVFGKTTPGGVNLQDLEAEAPGGFAIAGSPPLLGAGFSLSLGEVNGDGLGDLLLGSTPSPDLSKAYLVYGKPDTSPVRLAALDVGAPGGLAIFGSGGDAAGFGTATGADLNGDGLDDLIVGTLVYPGAAPSAGGAYAVFAWDMSGALGARRAAIVRGAADDVIDWPSEPVVGIRAGRGTDTLRVTGSGSALDLRASALSCESIEVVDLRGTGPNTLILDDAAVRRLPATQREQHFALAKTLSVLANGDDILYFDLTGYTQVGGNDGRIVYARDGGYYGLEVSQGTRIVWPPP